MARPRRVSHAFDDADVALGAAAQRLQRRLVARAVMRRGRLLHAVELDHDDAFGEALFIDLGGVAARQEASAAALDRRPGELGVFRQSVVVLDGAICGDGVALARFSRIPDSGRKAL